MDMSVIRLCPLVGVVLSSFILPSLTQSQMYTQ